MMVTGVVAIGGRGEGPVSGSWESISNRAPHFSLAWQTAPGGLQGLLCQGCFREASVRAPYTPLCPGSVTCPHAALGEA